MDNANHRYRTSWKGEGGTGGAQGGCLRLVQRRGEPPAESEPLDKGRFPTRPVGHVTPSPDPGAGISTSPDSLGEANKSPPGEQASGPRIEEDCVSESPCVVVGQAI